MGDARKYGFLVFASRSAGMFSSSVPKKPTAPTSLSVDNTTTYGSMILSWTAPVNTGFPAVTSYSVEIVGVTTINTGSTGTSYTWTGGTRGTSYSFKVYANNSAGQSVASGTVGPTTVNGNLATGGTTADIANYNGTGQTWRTHTFTGSSTLTSSSSQQNWSILCVGGGGVGIGTYGGEGGQVVQSTTSTIPFGANSVTVGAGGVTSADGAGAAGGDSSVGSVLTALGARSMGANLGNASPGGGGNRGANAGSAQSGVYGGAGGVGVSSSVSGTATYYGGGGGGSSGDGGVPNSGGAGGAGGGGHGSTTRTNGTDGLGGGSGGYFWGAKSGGSGVVIVAYRLV